MLLLIVHAPVHADDQEQKGTHKQQLIVWACHAVHINLQRRMSVQYPK